MWRIRGAAPGPQPAHGAGEAGAPQLEPAHTGWVRPRVQGAHRGSCGAGAAGPRPQVVDLGAGCAKQVCDVGAGWEEKEVGGPGRPSGGAGVDGTSLQVSAALWKCLTSNHEERGCSVPEAC